jgi:hypothetical protein
MPTPFLSIFAEHISDYSKAAISVRSNIMGTETSTEVRPENGDRDPSSDLDFLGTETSTRTREDQDPFRESDPHELFGMWEMSVL